MITEDEDVTVEVDDDSTDQSFHTSKVDSESSQLESSFVNDILQQSIEFVEQYGWFILIFAIVLYILMTKKSSRSSSDAAQSRQGQASSSKSEKIDEKEAAARERHLEAMMRARERQQEENNRLVEEYRAIQQAKQAEREAQQLAEYERLHGKSEGYKLGSSNGKPSSSKPDSQQSAPKPSSSGRLRTDNYMPLGGAGGGSYRPGGARCRPGARSS